MKKLEMLLQDRIKEIESEEGQRLEREAIKQAQRAKEEEKWEHDEYYRRANGIGFTSWGFMVAGTIIAIIHSFNCPSSWNTDGLKCTFKYFWLLPVGLAVGFLIGVLIFQKRHFKG